MKKTAATRVMLACVLTLILFVFVSKCINKSIEKNCNLFFEVYYFNKKTREPELFSTFERNKADSTLRVNQNYMTKDEFLRYMSATLYKDSVNTYDICWLPTDDSVKVKKLIDTYVSTNSRPVNKKIK